MGWLIELLFSSIGKKQVMATTGLLFCAFLAVHLIGNLTIYGGRETFNSYSSGLHSLGFIIPIIEWGLLLLALIHITIAVFLYFEDIYARPVRYVMKKNAGGRTLSSALMPYTGLYLFVFVIIHLFTFHFTDRTNQSLFQIMESVFSRPGYVIFYAISVIVAALHIKHGFWSAFQTFGANHPKYMPLIHGASWAFSIIVAIGFGSIPIYMMPSF